MDIADRVRDGKTVLAALVLALVLALLALVAPHAASAQKVYACPQADGPVRYQDRPCAATLPTPPPPPKAPLPPTRISPPVPASGTAGTRGDGPRAAASTPVAPASAPPSEVEATALPATRAEYVARNERRCSAGDRRACVAVTCERSGGLGTKECQAALGYRRGPGWDLRPASDVFEPARGEDDYTLRCTAQPRRARVVVPRDGGAARVIEASKAATAIRVDGVAEFARTFCAPPAAPGTAAAAGTAAAPGTPATPPSTPAREATPPR